MRKNHQSHCFQWALNFEWIAALLAIAWIGPFVASASAALVDSIDVFPLEKNRQWTYNFVWKKTDVWSGIAESVSDSGRLEYLVMDSVRTTDTTVVWSVRQTEHLDHRHTYGAAFDSAYRIDRVSFVVLIESTIGLHALECDSKVWAFTKWRSGCGAAATPVYRYWSDTTHTLCQTDENSWGQYLYFSTSRGLYRRWRFMTSGSNHRDELTADLVEELTSVDMLDHASAPLRIQLFQNYPNPFNPTTAIRYALPARSHVTLAVFNTLGQQVAVLQNGEQGSGYHESVFNARRLPSGVYFYRLQAGSFAETKRMLIAR